MTRDWRRMAACCLLLMLLSFTGCGKGDDRERVNRKDVAGIPVKGTVTLVDLGSKSCTPCKMMEPILAEVKQDYQGRAAVIFLDVKEPANADKTGAFGLMAIPTQIFFDRQGKEVYRHIGYLDKKSIVGKLEELLAQP